MYIQHAMMPVVCTCLILEPTMGLKYLPGVLPDPCNPIISVAYPLIQQKYQVWIQLIPDPVSALYNPQGYFLFFLFHPAK